MSWLFQSKTWIKGHVKDSAIFNGQQHDFLQVGVHQTNPLNVLRGSCWSEHVSKVGRCVGLGVFCGFPQLKFVGSQNRNPACGFREWAQELSFLLWSEHNSRMGYFKRMSPRMGTADESPESPSLILSETEPRFDTRKMVILSVIPIDCVDWHFDTEKQIVFPNF